MIAGGLSQRMMPCALRTDLAAKSAITPPSGSRMVSLIRAGLHAGAATLSTVAGSSTAVTFSARAVTVGTGFSYGAKAGLVTVGLVIDAGAAVSGATREVGEHPGTVRRLDIGGSL